MRAFLCWAPERGETREHATDVNVSPTEGPSDAAEAFARILYDRDPLAEDESIVVHVSPVSPHAPCPFSAWRVVVVVETHLRARPA